MKNKLPPLCKDCKWFTGLELIFPFGCIRPVLRKSKADFVHGPAESYTGEVALYSKAHVERERGKNKCGPEGKYWEPK